MQRQSRESSGNAPKGLPTAPELRAYVEGRRAETVSERSRVGIPIILFVLVLLAVTRLPPLGTGGLPEFALYVGTFAAQSTILYLITRDPVPAYARALVVAGAAVTCLLVGGLATAEHNTQLAQVLLPGFVMGCAALLPTGPWWQTILALAAGVAVLVNATMSGHARPTAGDIDTLLPSIIVLVTSVYAAYELERSRLAAAREELGRAAAEADLRGLNAELEYRVDERTAELRALNDELRSFSYTVSHDLRAPLRTINGFGHRLAEELGEGLSEGADESLARILDATLRMGDMIDSLLALGRVTRAEIHREHVDLGALAAGIVAELRHAHPERPVQVEIGDGLAACGDPMLLHIALQNLLSNAWKFTAPRPDARIELRSERGPDDRTVYVVSDNGVGFDQDHGEQIFGTFTRLHRVDEFEGTGVGLATVARVVQRHGGRVWAEGRAGAGACFRFTLGDTDAPATTHAGAVARAEPSV